MGLVIPGYIVSCRLLNLQRWRRLYSQSGNSQVPSSSQPAIIVIWAAFSHPPQRFGLVFPSRYSPRVPVDI